MKKLILLSVFILTLQADHIDDFATLMKYETNYETAIAKAKAQNKAVMLVMVTHYCPWCRKFEKKALKKKAVSTLVNTYFVPLILNREKRAFPEKFDTPRIPTTYFINPTNEKIIRSNMGYKNKKEFLSILHKVITLLHKR